MSHPHTQNDAVPEPTAEQHLGSDLHSPNNVVDAQNAPKSPLSEFDDYVAASERNDGARTGTSRDLGFGFEVGDMVWGKVKSHPWWPGHIFNEAFASPAVRRTRREGHVLVAFFGDSSYGWFEPSELVPFEPSFAEKSRQVSSRTFQRAVEEAVDEASRRCGLGLVCTCRNSAKFRPAGVEGYFHVDVPEYEPGVYSSGQIRRAREGFAPRETVDFVRHLAVAPCGGGGDRRSIGFAKNKATVFALRRAVFEQYDETYAEAFGVQPTCPADRKDNVVDQPVRQAVRAPLSGPLVIAETLGDEKNSTKSVKVKDKVKQDKHLFKQRDEHSNSLQLASGEETPDSAGHYVFQKKRAPDGSAAPQIITKHGDAGFIGQDNAASLLNAGVVVEGQIQPDGSGLASQAITLEPEAKPYLLDKGKESSEEITRNFELDNIASKSMCRPDCSGEMALPSIVDETSRSSHLESKLAVDVKHDGNVKLSGPREDFRQTEKGFLTVANDMHQVKCASNVLYTSPVEVKSVKTSVDGVLKKVQGHKRPADDLNSGTSATGAKKKKKGLNLQPISAHLEKHFTVGKSVHVSGNLIKKPASIGSASGEDLRAEPADVDASACNLLPADTTGEVDRELPQLLDDLQALALDPFHGVKRGIPAVAQQCFLQFRSLVYQKSLLLSPPSENEAPEVQVTKSPSSVGASDSADDHVRDSSPVKPVKHIVRPDDPTKTGRKRALSDRQEEITAKRLKKIKDLKALAAEKKAAIHKTSEAWQGDRKESMVQASPKILKLDLARKVERPSKPVEPTILVIKFPPRTSLPSIAELKARFARFGPIDQSGLRVFWKTSTCRVVFLHKIDAQAAYKYAVANQSLFGNVGVRCFLREFGDAASEVSEAAKVRGDDGANETPRVKDPAVVQRQTLVSAHQPLPQPVIQLKSILKKSTGDELGQVASNGGSSKGTPRVKFVLGGEENSRGEQLVVGNRNNFNNASFADGGAPSPVAMDFNSKNVQKVNSQPSLPNLPLLTQFKKSPQHNLHNSEMAPRNSPNFFNQSASATATTVDISNQMISLLTRCSDVVTNLTCLLGYVPYHPL